jgi:hypothetical protein
MVVPFSSNIFPPKSVSVAASRPSRVRLPKGFAGSSMKRGPPGLSLWTFSRWHKFLLPTDLNDAFLVIAYLTDKPTNRRDIRVSHQQFLTPVKAWEAALSRCRNAGEGAAGLPNRPPRLVNCKKCEPI